MPAIPLSPLERKTLKAQAHHLSPVVAIGADGLTAAVQKEINSALQAHGLIKIRVFSDDRAQREAWHAQLAGELNAAAVQHIGKLILLWRPPEAKVKEVDPDRMAGPREFKVLKYSKRGGQRPEVRRLTVLGNERLTATGKIKRAKPKQKSIKKQQG